MTSTRRSLATACLLLTWVTSPLNAQDAPPPGQAGIERVTYNGTGCGPGTVNSAISADGQAITVIFSDYVVSTDQRGRIRKACNLHLKMNIPDGWEYSLFGVDVRGYASISERSVGRLNVQYNFAGERRSKLIEMNIRGPSHDDYYQSAVLNASESAWSGCGDDRNLRLTTAVAIVARADGGSSITLDTLDGELLQNYRVTWRRCPGAQPTQVSCRVALKNPNGQDVQEFVGTASSALGSSALSQARNRGLMRCEQARGNRPRFRCVVTDRECQMAP